LFFSVTVNGKKVQTSANLAPGDTIVVGKTSFRYAI